MMCITIDNNNNNGELLKVSVASRLINYWLSGCVKSMIGFKLNILINVALHSYIQGGSASGQLG